MSTILNFTYLTLDLLVQPRIFIVERPKCFAAQCFSPPELSAAGRLLDFEESGILLLSRDASFTSLCLLPPFFYFPVPHVRQRGLFYGSNLGDSVPDVFKVFCTGTASSGNAILLDALQNG